MSMVYCHKLKTCNQSHQQNYRANLFWLNNEAVHTSKWNIARASLKNYLKWMRAFLFTCVLVAWQYIRGITHCQQLKNQLRKNTQAEKSWFHTHGNGPAKHQFLHEEKARENTSTSHTNSHSTSIFILQENHKRISEISSQSCLVHAQA